MMSTTTYTLFRPTPLALALSLCTGVAHAAPHFTLSNPTPTLGDGLSFEVEAPAAGRTQLYIGKSTGGNVPFEVTDPNRGSDTDPLTLNINVSANRLPLSTSVWNNGVAEYSGRIQSGDAYNWDTNTTISGFRDGQLTLSADRFESGIYLLTLKDSDADTEPKTAFVTVAPDAPGSTSKVLLLDNDFSGLVRSEYVTAQGALNIEGLSPLDFSWPRRSSLDRAARLGPNQAPFDFTAWADNNDLPIEVMSMRAVHSNPALLDNYDLVVVTGRSQYWTSELRTALIERVEAGVLNLALFSGQTMANQVRLEQENDDTYLVNYNHSWVAQGYADLNVRTSPDPAAPASYLAYNAAGFADAGEKAQAARVAGSLSLPPLSNSSDTNKSAVGTTDQFTGQSAVSRLPVESQVINYQVNPAKAEHWAFEGVNGTLAVNSPRFTQIDGAEWTLVGSELGISPNNTTTPSNIQVLAYSTDVPANNNHQAAITLMPKGQGFVFNVGNSGWVSAMDREGNDALSALTKNVIDCLSAAEGNPASPTCSGETPANPETPTAPVTPETPTTPVTPETPATGTDGGTDDTTGSDTGSNSDDSGDSGGGGSLGFASLLGLALLRKRR